MEKTGSKMEDETLPKLHFSYVIFGSGVGLNVTSP